MNEKEFCYWLKGYFELSGAKNLSEAQVEIVKEHLKLVFNKVTPDINPNLPYIYKPLEWLKNPTTDKVEITCTADQPPDSFSTFLGRTGTGRLC